MNVNQAPLTDCVRGHKETVHILLNFTVMKRQTGREMGGALMCKDAEKKRKKEKDAARPGVSGEERGKN